MPKRSSVRFPIRAHAWVAGSVLFQGTYNPWLGACRRHLIGVCLSVFSFSKSNGEMSLAGEERGGEGRGGEGEKEGERERSHSVMKLGDFYITGIDCKLNVKVKVKTGCPALTFQG